MTLSDIQTLCEAHEDLGKLIKDNIDKYAPILVAGLRWVCEHPQAEELIEIGAGQVYRAREALVKAGFTKAEATQIICSMPKPKVPTK